MDICTSGVLLASLFVFFDYYSHNAPYQLAHFKKKISILLYKLSFGRCNGVPCSVTYEQRSQVDKIAPSSAFLFSLVKGSLGGGMVSRWPSLSVSLSSSVSSGSSLTNLDLLP